jgi:LPS-assembly lipoprotein
VPVLQLHSESSVSQVLAIDSSGRISAYLLNYRVDYLLLSANSKPLLPKQSVKLQREYTFDRLNVLATEKQTEFLQHEMRRDVAQQILRRLASLNSATARDSGSAEREAVPTGTSAGAVSPPRDSEDHADQH